MITTFILFVIYGVIYLLTSPFRLVSDVSVDSGIGGAIVTATAYFANLNELLPLSTFAICIGLILAVELIISIYKIVMWVIRRLPTQS